MPPDLSMGRCWRTGKDMFEQRIQGITDGLERDPAAFGDAAGQLEEAFTMGVGQGLFRPEEAKARLHDAREKLSLTAFDNMYAMDRGRAMGSMEALGLTPAQQAKAKKRYQADVRSDAAQARAAANERKAELLSTIEDDDYTAKMTGDVSSLMKTASELRRLATPSGPKFWSGARASTKTTRSPYAKATRRRCRIWRRASTDCIRNCGRCKPREPRRTRERCASSTRRYPPERIFTSTVPLCSSKIPWGRPCRAKRRSKSRKPTSPG